MAQRATVSTPAQAARSVINDPPPGTWNHPQFDEIQKRLNASTFGSDNIRIAAFNITALLLTFLIPLYVEQHLTFITASYGAYGLIFLYSARAYFFSRLLYALMPLLRSRDDLLDIPLTPTQRALLGLAPSTTPATPGSKFVTPPRYSRSVTPRSDKRSQPGSPYSGSPSMGVSAGADPTSYSPSASPLFQRAMGREITRRLSYGTPSPLGQTKSLAFNDSSSSFVPSTPSPTTNKGGPSVPLNSRWLYDRERSSPSIRSIYS